MESAGLPQSPVNLAPRHGDTADGADLDGEVQPGAADEDHDVDGAALWQGGLNH
jgi:hypothetical protein